jgi:hypothetical protein
MTPGRHPAAGQLRVRPECSVRVMMGTAFTTGHAVGVAAVQCADAGRLDAAAVRAELVRQAAVLSLSIPTGAVTSDRVHLCVQRP